MVEWKRGPRTEGSGDFDPARFLSTWPAGTRVHENDLEQCIKSSFRLRNDDNYVYHATASVTLAQVQRAIGHGAQFGLHAWYHDANGNQEPNPPPTDILAYTSIFSPSTNTSKALTAFVSNAKKGSRRASIALHLLANRMCPTGLKIPKCKSHVNPYLDMWSWSCQNLEWAGPDESIVNVKQSHHILPVFYHHFGCVCPSYEALETIKAVSKGRVVVDIGSGNGYWTFMLRQIGVEVVAVDNGDSVWRTEWIGDTVHVDGRKYLSTHKDGSSAVLLLVYPQIGGGFTKKILDGYKGDTICIAGTQNRNGFTAFGDITIDRYIEENMPEWRKIVQTPLPSFAGKDEALFVFSKISSE